MIIYYRVSYPGCDVLHARVGLSIREYCIYLLLKHRNKSIVFLLSDHLCGWDVMCHVEVRCYRGPAGHVYH